MDPILQEIRKFFIQRLGSSLHEGSCCANWLANYSHGLELGAHPFSNFPEGFFFFDFC
ncbi:hypothetical protein NC653_032529 [Populus alba x Populus x berolinensis]|uniref:Uncharacterized protein n=1 Tax=Populus alba x Populus x berolinensis TaxID=444605 RepID=A0AAD6PY44_9ROSI|nr:hypothetical protein NC653_032527 [Populus alba x Populus x berolinensis]KAJ6971994.1 hypothetical protein NC653_032529 [Populus alba x Populus x berolinensis]